ncbi:WG repeat-containing protein [uncultured Erythrobacter sp.]|uniref:WG repeat-containing protein n=1 Tax=uncultured Erythrobacter sp. TaxID=263913 RepID=UPI0026072991|nr:WG repeat-containing protein [uncultured Erythrobacter sp.]
MQQKYWLSMGLMMSFGLAPLASAANPVENEFETSLSGFSCDRQIVGDAIKTANDGGGRMSIGIDNARIVNQAGVIIRPLSYDVRLERYKDLVFITDQNQKIGLLDLCDDAIVTAPKFDQISGFSSDGFAIAFTPTEFTALDASGAEIPPRRFKHQFTLSTFNAFPKAGWGDSWKSQRGLIPFSWDGESWGLYDLNGRTIRTEPQFEAIYPDRRYGGLRDDDPLYFKVVDGDKQSFIDSSTGTLALPFIFVEIDKIVAFGGKRYGLGSLGPKVVGRGKRINAYDIANNRFLLPLDSEFDQIRPIDSYGLSPRLWAVGRYIQDQMSLGLFEEDSGNFLIPPAAFQGDRIQWLRDDLFIFSRINDRSSAVFSATDGAQLTGYDQGSGYQGLSLAKNGASVPFHVLHNKMHNTFWIYGSQHTLILEGITGDDPEPRIENGLFVFTERPSRKRYEQRTTCLNSDYQIVGNRFDCNPELVGTSSVPQPEFGWVASLPCDHKMFNRKKNIAAQAHIDVSSTYCDSTGCYDERSLVDGDRSDEVGFATSWASDGQDGGFVEFSWRRPYQGMEQIYFVGSWQKRVENYKIEVSTVSGWKTVADVQKNDDNKVCHRFPPTDVSVVRISGTGSDDDSRRLRLNEVVIR